jgi:hypothetical protein
MTINQQGESDTKVLWTGRLQMHVHSARGARLLRTPADGGYTRAAARDGGGRGTGEVPSDESEETRAKLLAS